MNRKELIAKNKRLEQENAALQFRLSNLERLVFGAKSERHVPDTVPNQLGLDFGLEVEQVVIEVEEQEIASHKRKKKHPGRRPLPDHLPVEQIIIEPDEDTTGLKKIGEDIVDTLDYEPASVKIKRYIFPKYAAADGQGIIRAKMPNRPINKGVAEAGLLAHFISQKFVYHIPFYRTITQFKQLYKVEIPKTSVNDWFIAVCTLMKPLYECLQAAVLNNDYIQADESPLKVLDQDKPGQSHQGYQWVYHAPEQGYVFFKYQKGRGKNGPKALLENYEGYLQTDGYVVYDKIVKAKPIELMGCMAHARRYFFKAKDSDPDRAEKALNYFKRLYQIERQIKEEQLNAEQTKIVRLEKSKPLLETLLQWAIQEKDKVVPKSPMGKAFTYLTLQWPKLIKYLQDGRLLIDNNLIENTIRPLALGRKNYLFAGSHAAAQRIAMIYSFFGTCKRLDLNPYTWLRAVLQQIAEHPINQLDELLPGDWVNKLDM